jgi:hypothetical protein
MAVSKRTRYEVLRRDNHTCRYCGGQAPDVVLTVDHVTPVALGGSDHPGNLVAACRDCNAGKAASAPDAAVVSQVSDDAIRWAAAMKEAMQLELAALGARQEYRENFRQAWSRWDDRLVLADPRWVVSVGRWHELGVPIEILIEAIDIAMSNTTVKPQAVFRYMAGVVWTYVRKAQDRVAVQLAEPGEDDDPQLSQWTLGFRSGWDDGFIRGVDYADWWTSDAVVHWRGDELPFELKSVAA